ncbi:MAG: hypothetical protein HYX37_18790 [Rhizobiales bacterium]|nr:hypothetical protein [Hyphomicrobiales bacterium]
MKRLMIATALLLATTGMSVWAQAPVAGDQNNPPQTVAPAPAQQTPQAMPMTNCPGNGGARAEGQQGCPMAPGDVKSEQGGMSVQEMMHDMMHGQMRHAGSHSDHGNCCELPKADKPK